MLKFKVEFELDEEQLQDIFDNNEVKFSKAKITKLKKILTECQSDFQEQLEETFEEILNDLINEEWGE